MGWFPPEGGDSYTWKLLGRNKRAVVLDLKTDDGPRRVAAPRRRRRRADRELPARARSNASVSVPTCCSRATRASSCSASPGFGQDGPYASRPGFATMAEAMSGFAAINGEPDGPPLLPPIALTDEVAGHRRRVRGDGRAARPRSHRRRSGGRRQPARVDAADDVGAAVGGGASRLRAAAARLGHPVLGAARHVPLRRRPVGRDLDLGGIGRAPRARAPRTRRRPALRHVRESRASTARSSTPSVAAWVGARPSAEVLGGVRRGRSGDRARVHDARPARRPARAGPATSSSRSTASSCRDRSPGCRAHPRRCGAPAGRSVPTPTTCWARSTTSDLTRRPRSVEASPTSRTVVDAVAGRAVARRSSAPRSA